VPHNCRHDRNFSRRGNSLHQHGSVSILGVPLSPSFRAAELRLTRNDKRRRYCVGRLKPCPDTCLVQKFLETRHAASLRRNRIRSKRSGAKSHSKQAIRQKVGIPRCTRDGKPVTQPRAMEKYSHTRGRLCHTTVVTTEILAVEEIPCISMVR
jgi:hypothetical protein